MIRVQRPLKASRPSFHPLKAATAGRELRLERDHRGIERIAYEKQGWKKWNWRGVDINYIESGDEGPPLVLLHGFGASAYQWRYNIPTLAKKHKVFAVDLVGFGKSEKLVTDYTGGEIWSEQIADFIREFVGEGGAYIAGNSLGGFAAFSTAARNPELIKGIIGLNVAGTFSTDPDLMPADEIHPSANFIEKTRKQIATLIRRLIISYTFYLTRSRIRKILLQVYHNKNNVDDDLVRSIQEPAEDPVASEVYYRLVQSALSKRTTLDSLLQMINAPMLLVWGMKDPWITPTKAEKILACYDNAEFVPLEAGHCVMDECPELVNEKVMSWIQRVEK